MANPSIENIESPLVKGGMTKKIDEISTEFLIAAYKKSLDIEVNGYLNSASIKIFECKTSGYQFYFPFNLGGDTAFYDKLRQFDWYYMPWKWEYEACSRWIPDKSSVLEVGCGKGYFIDYLQKEKAARCIGLELISEDERKSNGPRILNIPLDKFSNENRDSFDVVCSFQVLEHIAAVRDFIKDQVKSLRKGGRLIISVPNNDSFIKYDHSFILNMPPHHMGLWNERSLSSLEDLFDLKLIDIQFEPLQTYHFDYYYRTLLKEKNNYIAFKVKKFLYKTFLKKRIHRDLKKQAGSIKGHTILAVYEKI